MALIDGELFDAENRGPDGRKIVQAYGMSVARGAPALRESAAWADEAWKQAAQRLIDQIDWSGGTGEGLNQELGYSPDDMDDPELFQGDDYKRRLLNWAEERCYDFFVDLEEMVGSGGKLPVWRMITAPADWEPEPGRHPGIYWSWDKDSADAHWGEFSAGQKKWLLSAKVTEADIDLVQTIAANSDPSTGKDEKEITLKPDSVIRYTYRKVS